MVSRAAEYHPQMTFLSPEGKPNHCSFEVPPVNETFENVRESFGKFEFTVALRPWLELHYYYALSENS